MYFIYNSERSYLHEMLELKTLSYPLSEGFLERISHICVHC
jgi:hypothetical protein